MKRLKKILKWTSLTLLMVLVIGFLYSYFIWLARPGSVSYFSDIEDSHWHTVDMGNESMCSDGSEYFIFVRKGKSDNVIVHFSGGGACWDDNTCTRPITLYKALTEGDSKDLKAFYFPIELDFQYKFLSGIFNNKEQENPFKDWNIVYIPYCTGDFHIGNTTTVYEADGSEMEVHHNGRNNVLTALDWVYTNFKAPKKILVSGESAGGFASAYWAPAVAEHYKDLQSIYQLSDGSQLTSDRWLTILNSVWKSDSRSLLKFDIGNDAYADALLNRYDSINERIKHLNSHTLYDVILPRFYASLNHRQTNDTGYIYEWSEHMKASIQRLDSSDIDYQYFLTNCRYDSEKVATPHTLLGSDSSLYHCRSNDLRYIDWLRKNILDDEHISAGSDLLYAKNKY